MGNAFRLKKKRLFYNLNRKRKKSAKKYQKTLEWLLLVLQKSKKDYMQNWVKATLPKVKARLKKYGITSQQIEKFFEAKGKKELLEGVQL